MAIDGKYGILLRDDVKLARALFREAVKLIGIQVFYRAPLEGKEYTTYGEIESNYAKPIKVGCIFLEHPNQLSMRKLGWISELVQGSSIIQVEYDLPNLQVGSLFIVPQGLDGDNGRVYRVINMMNEMVYPATMTCEIVPEFEDTISPSKIEDFTTTSFSYISRDEDDI